MFITRKQKGLIANSKKFKIEKNSNHFWLAFRVPTDKRSYAYATESSSNKDCPSYDGRTTFFVCKTRAKRSVAPGSERSKRTSVDDVFLLKAKITRQFSPSEQIPDRRSSTSLRRTKSII